MIYFDNAATTWPKPPAVKAAMSHFLDEIGANPGRAGHRLAVDAGRVLYDTREAVAALFNAPDPLQIAFAPNVTFALNQALHGLLRPGDHVITSAMEHNSVMRPLRVLQAQGLSLTVIPCQTNGTLDPDHVEAALQSNTTMIVLNHASNVIGTVLPIADVGQIARQHSVLLLVDTAQTAGAYPLDMQADAIDLLAFTGHKALFGPTGTGGLIVGERVDPNRFRPLLQGGTGSHSEHETQPDFLPDQLESGTPNVVGIAGLQASINWIMERGVEAIRSHDFELTKRLLEGLQAIDGVTVYGTKDATRQTATVSFSVCGVDPSTIGLRLDEEYNIMCRVGLHCAPAAHRTIGTFPGGTVRFGMSYFNTIKDVETALQAVEALSRETR